MVATAARGWRRGTARASAFTLGVTKTGYALHGPFVGAGGAVVRPTTSFASTANRVSHVLDLNGPSVPVDTMCSSSLTAIHAACEALRADTCALALRAAEPLPPSIEFSRNSPLRAC